jgi:hypothetical protein
MADLRLRARKRWIDYDAYNAHVRPNQTVNAATSSANSLSSDYSYDETYYDGNGEDLDMRRAEMKKGLTFYFNIIYKP